MNSILPIDWLLIVLWMTNLWAFVMFAHDKRQARIGGRRVPEAELLQLTLIGGFGAWLGQHILRHKTRKEPFRSNMGAMLVGHVVLTAAAVGTVLLMF